MADDLAASNVNRSYSLAATSIAIFTFMLLFLYARSTSGEINRLLFQSTSLSVPHSLLGTHLIVDVATEAVPLDDATVPVARRRRTARHPSIDPILATQAVT